MGRAKISPIGPRYHPPCTAPSGIYASLDSCDNGAQPSGSNHAHSDAFFQMLRTDTGTPRLRLAGNKTHHAFETCFKLKSYKIHVYDAIQAQTPYPITSCC